MEHEQIMSKVKELLAEYIHDHTIDSVDEKSLSSTTDFAYDLEMDSLAMAEFLSKVENAFYPLEFFSNGEIDGIKTIDDLVRSIEKQKASQNASVDDAYNDY